MRRKGKNTLAFLLVVCLALEPMYAMASSPLVEDEFVELEEQNSETATEQSVEESMAEPSEEQIQTTDGDDPYAELKEELEQYMEAEPEPTEWTEPNAIQESTKPAIQAPAVKESVKEEQVEKDLEEDIGFFGSLKRSPLAQAISAVYGALKTAANKHTCNGVTVQSASVKVDGNDVGKPNHKIIGPYVGPYKYKIIGGTTLHDHQTEYDDKYKPGTLSNTASDKVKKAAKSVLGKTITNSTIDTLGLTDGGEVYKAFLVWQSRASNTCNAPIALAYQENAKSKAYAVTVTAAKTYADRRKTVYGSGANSDHGDDANITEYANKMYCAYADVTDFVAKHEDGIYAVCNIPIRTSGLTDGGENPACWQLIVIEENTKHPTSVLQWSIGSTFTLTDGYEKAPGVGGGFQGFNVDFKLPLGNYKIASEGSTVQAFAISTTTTGSPEVLLDIKFLDSESQELDFKRMSNVAIGDNVNDHRTVVYTGNIKLKSETTASVMATVDNSQDDGMGGKGAFFTLYSFGVAIEVEDFTPDMPQRTATVSAADNGVANEENVRVFGMLVNRSEAPKTGYESGTLTVTLDSKLTPISKTVKLIRHTCNPLPNLKGDNAMKIAPGSSTYGCNCKSGVTGTVSGGTITFSGLTCETDKNALSNYWYSYYVECDAAYMSGKTHYNNSHTLSYTKSLRGVTISGSSTKAQSKSKVKYKLTITGDQGIQSIAGTIGDSNKSFSRASASGNISKTYDVAYDTECDVNAYKITPTPAIESIGAVSWSSPQNFDQQVNDTNIWFDMPTSNVTINASAPIVWQKFKVKYHYNTMDGAAKSGATNTKEEVRKYVLGDSITGPKGACTGYEFLGWSKTSGGTTPLANPTCVVESDFSHNGHSSNNDNEVCLDLYAIYGKIVTLSFVEYTKTAQQCSYDAFTTLGDGDKKVHNYTLTIYNGVPVPFTMPQPQHSTYGWVFEGWADETEAGWTGGTTDGSCVRVGLDSPGTIIQVTDDATFYAQQRHDGCAYFIQQMKVDTLPMQTWRNSRYINKYVKTGTGVAPVQTPRDGWTAVGWTTKPDCKAQKEFSAGNTITFPDMTVYYGLYKKDVTLNYDSNGYDPIQSMPSSVTQTAYYTSAAWDRDYASQYTNVGRKHITANGWLAKWFQANPSAKKVNMEGCTGFSYPTFSIASLVPVYRKINQKETDVKPIYWCKLQNGSSLASESSVGWLEPYTIPIRCNPGNIWELRDSMTLYQQYETVAIPSQNRKHHSISILADDTLNIANKYLSDEISDKGRYYVSDNQKIATVTQDGTVRGISDGTTMVRVYASDGKTPVGDCTVTVSTCSVTIPSVLPLGTYAEVGVNARAGGNASVTAKLTMEALSGLQGSSASATYRLYGFKRTDRNALYIPVSEGGVIAEATANQANRNVSSKIQFKVDPSVAYEELMPGNYTAEIVWRLELKLN